MIHALSTSVFLGSHPAASSAYQHNQTDLEALAGRGANPGARDFDGDKNEVSIESLEARLAAASPGIERGTHALLVLMADCGGQFCAHADATGVAGRNQ